MTKTISIIVPIYNEAKNIPVFYQALVQVLEKITNYDFEIILVDDGSQDKSFKQIIKLADQDKRIKYIQFSRNFGKEMATTAGLNHSTGEAVMMIDVDIQHPPRYIPEFIEKWERGAEIVIGVRNGNNGEGLIKKWGSVVFYRLIRLIADTKIIPQATDFRLLDRRVADEFNKFTERCRITRGLIDWLGFQRDYVYFESPARLDGRATYNTLKLVKLALSSFISHSLLPLKLAGYAGVIIIAVSGPVGLFIIIENYILNDRLGMNFTGPAMLAVFTLFLVGIVLSCLGLIALYIANIHTEISGRPMYVVRNKKLEMGNGKRGAGNKKVVAVSGYFNPLHTGHLRLFEEAKKLGDYLAVIINNDYQVNLKGSVPFMAADERAEIVKAVKWVDEVFMSVDRDRSVCASLRAVRPDIFANGGDRHEGNVPEAVVCQELGIQMIDNVGGAKLNSSSELIRNSFKKVNHSKT